MRSLVPVPLLLAATALGGVAVTAPVGAATPTPTPTPANSASLTIAPKSAPAGTRPRITYAVTNTGKTSFGLGAAPYALQRSGVAGWSDIPWDKGIVPQYILVLRPGQTQRGTTVRIPSGLTRGTYRFIVRSTPNAAPDPLAAATFILR